MLKALKTILEIQEFDMQMIQLMRLKLERLADLKNIQSVKDELGQKTQAKEEEILELKKTSRLLEGEVQEVIAKLKKLEAQQNMIKKVDEFNALSQEMSQTDRERVAKELKASDILDKLGIEEETLKQIKDSLTTTKDSSRVLEAEISESIHRINEEGRILKDQRDKLVTLADPEVFRVYERLLRNKKDRVVVSIENRCCSGCHIMLTAQDENMVRKGERLVFCEHCSRIHYWPETVVVVEGAPAAQKPRRRRTSTKV
jgi:predicted  nucleic acid-binding Zn-ribbon protein